MASRFGNNHKNIILNQLKDKRTKQMYANLFHVKKDLDSFSIANVDTFDAHVDFEHRALVFVSSLVEVSMAFLQTN